MQIRIGLKSLIISLVSVTVLTLLLSCITNSKVVSYALTGLALPTAAGLSIAALRQLRTKEMDAQIDASKVAAMERSQAVIEFNLDGTIRHANENFLQTLGYTQDEIAGRHHSLFVEETYRLRRPITISGQRSGAVISSRLSSNASARVAR